MSSLESVLSHSILSECVLYDTLVISKFVCIKDALCLLNVLALFLLIDKE